MAKKIETAHKKTACPITRKDFAEKAPAILALSLLGGMVVGKATSGVAEGFPVGSFSTGSMGWNANGKVTLDIGGVPVQCQVGLNVTVIGSKELPK